MGIYKTGGYAQNVLVSKKKLLIKVQDEKSEAQQRIFHYSRIQIKTDGHAYLVSPYKAVQLNTGRGKFRASGCPT